MAPKPKKDPAAPKEPKPRNIHMDKLAWIEGQKLAQVTPSGWSAIAKALKEIRAVTPEVTPEELVRRARNYQLHYPKIKVTALGLAKWWGLCDKPPFIPSQQIRKADNV